MDHTPEGEMAYYAAINVAQDYDDLLRGAGVADLNDLKRLKTGKAMIPGSFPTARAMLQAFIVLMRTLFGADHNLVGAIEAFVHEFIGRESFYSARISAEDPRHGPARLLRYVQLHVRNWFQMAWDAEGAYEAAALPLPKLTEGLGKVHLGDMSWLPKLPAAYTTPPAAKAAAGGGGGGGAVPKEPAPKATVVTNPNRSELFDPFQSKIASSKFNDIIERIGGPPKVKRSGAEVAICVSYHLRGSCFSNCKRKADHAAHTDAEDAKLLEWCKKAFE
jgi:hypothetical protein